MNFPKRFNFARFGLPQYYPTYNKSQKYSANGLKLYENYNVIMKYETRIKSENGVFEDKCTICERIFHSVGYRKQHMKKDHDDLAVGCIK